VLEKHLEVYLLEVEGYHLRNLYVHLSKGLKDLPCVGLLLLLLESRLRRRRERGLVGKGEGREGKGRGGRGKERGGKERE